MNNIKSSFNWGLWVVVVLLLSACQRGSSTPVPIPVQPNPERMLIRERGTLFSTSGECAACHTGIKDKKNADVSIDSAWRSTMMANAARDPYYLASVRSESLRFPAYRDAIEEKCSTCHYPMAFFTAIQQKQSTRILDDGFKNSNHSLHPLGIDGVSCTVCHQIEPANMADIEGTFSGNFKIDIATESGTRKIFGKFPVEPAAVTIMQSTTGFIPFQSMHISRPPVCATCHTLFTSTILADGSLSKEPFPEQTPFLEWQNSDYHGVRFCQNCHMPQANGEVLISTVGGKERSPFSQHLFVGGNHYMLSLMEKNASAIKATAEDQHFQITQNHTTRQLTEQTATLDLKGERRGDTLALTVKITSLVGHKFPSGFPSRRAWLHVVVRDQMGNTIFESGGYDQFGNITDNDNDKDAALFEKHYQSIIQADQVQIYESIMADENGKVTTQLLSAASYLKDNRLLPKGFNKSTVPNVVGVIGDALSDEDFVGGSDQVEYQVKVGAGELQITVELLYQSLGAQWAEKLNKAGNQEGQQFLNMVKAQPILPVVVAKQSIRLR